MIKKFLLFGAFLSAALAFGRSANNVYVIPNSGVPVGTWGQVNLSSPSAVASTLPVSNGGTGESSYTSASIPYFDGTVLNQSNTNLNFNATTLGLDLGVVPGGQVSGVTAQLTVDTANNTGSGGGSAIIIEGNNNKERLKIYSNSQPVLAGLYMGTSVYGTSQTVPSSVVDLLDIQGSASTAVSGNSTDLAARIILGTSGAWTSGSSYPSQITFYTTPSGSTTLTQAMQLTSAQALVLPDITISADQLSTTNTNASFLFTPNGNGWTQFGANNAGAYPPNQGALAIGYNFTSGQQEVDFFNTEYSSAPSTSFNFYQQTGASSNTKLFSLSPTGVPTFPVFGTAGVLTNSASGVISSATTTGTLGSVVQSVSPTLTGSPIIDNFTFSNNRISANNTNGNIDLWPNGTGFLDVNQNSGSGVYPSSSTGNVSLGYNFDGTTDAVDLWNVSNFSATGGFSFRQLTGASSQTKLMNISSSGVLTLPAISTAGALVTNTSGVVSSRHAITQQTLTSASGTYTTPSGVTYLVIKMAGGGGGGAGSGTSGAAARTGGNSTVFGSNLTAVGGSAGGIGSGGSGGTCTTTGLSTGYGLPGQAGAGPPAQSNESTAQSIAGGFGGNSGLFNGGGSPVTGGAGGSGVANSGAGGAGAGVGASPVNSSTGGGGGAGCSIYGTISSPASTYSYGVGATASGGSAGASGFAGGTGSAGVIYVEEHYD